MRKCWISRSCSRGSFQGLQRKCRSSVSSVVWITANYQGLSAQAGLIATKALIFSRWQHVTKSTYAVANLASWLPPAHGLLTAVAVNSRSAFEGRLRVIMHGIVGGDQACAINLIKTPKHKHQAPATGQRYVGNLPKYDRPRSQGYG